MCDPKDPLYQALVVFSKDLVSVFFSFHTTLKKSSVIRNFKLQGFEIIKEFSSQASNWDKLQFTRLCFVKLKHSVILTFFNESEN